MYTTLHFDIILYAGVKEIVNSPQTEKIHP